MPSDEPLRPYNWRLKSLAKLKLIKISIILTLFRDYFVILLVKNEQYDA